MRPANFKTGVSENWKEEKNLHKNEEVGGEIWKGD